MEVKNKHVRRAEKPNFRNLKAGLVKVSSRHQTLMKMRRINPDSLKRMQQINWYYLMGKAQFGNYQLSTSRSALSEALSYAFDLHEELGNKAPKAKHYRLLIECMLFSRDNSNHQILEVINEALNRYPKDKRIKVSRLQVHYRKDI